MDSQNVEIVRSLYKAYVARDWDNFKGCIGDRCVWIDSRGGQHVGPEEVASYFQGWLASCSDESLEVAGFYDSGTTVVVERCDAWDE